MRGTRVESRKRPEAFVLYVEGPRDLEILGYWAKRIDPALARCVEEKTVILGGKQPARAISDFSDRGGRQAGISGLIVLDRDDQIHSDHDEVRSLAAEVGLEVFVWSLRHIESYLLVPDVIRRVHSLPIEDKRIEDLIHREDPNDDVKGAAATVSCDALESSIHAKRVLGANGVLAELLGVEVKAGEIARAMRREDLHEDVLGLFERVRDLSGVAASGPEVEVIVRKPRAASLKPETGSVTAAEAGADEIF